MTQLPGQAPYDSLINDAAAEFGVPAGLLAADLFVESSFNPKALSPAGAQGIAQFMPETAKQYGVDVHSPASSIRGQAHYLRDLFDQLGSWDAALEAYSGNTAGYAAKVDSYWTGSHATPPATGKPAGGTSPAGDAASALTDWLTAGAMRVGCIIFGALLLLIGLRRMVN